MTGVQTCALPISELSELAQAEDRPDPQDLLEFPLRHGRTAHITVVVADHLDALDRIKPTVRSATRARVVLGALDPDLAPEALGVPLDITPSSHTPPGRGYARLGTNPPVRIQVPAAPDPLDEETPADQRDAVIALLPHADSRTEAPAAPILTKPVSDRTPPDKTPSDKTPPPVPAALDQDRPAPPPESAEERTGEISQPITTALPLL